jgi:hypothetical protein
MVAVSLLAVGFLVHPLAGVVVLAALAWFWNRS